jgi:hypothetical protein
MLNFVSPKKIKLMRSSITILFFLFAVSIASASSLEITPSSNAVYNVYYKGTAATSVKVTIFNSKNRVVFTETIYSAGFRRPYNFRELPAGQYKVVVSGKDGEQVQTIDHKVVAASSTKSLIRVTSLSGNDDRYLVTIANSSSQNVWIRIYNNGQGLVHEEKITVDGSAAQVFNLSKIQGRNKSAIQFEIVTEQGQIETMTF